MDTSWLISMLLLQFSAVLSQDDKCVVNDFKVAQNFEPDKFEGQWFLYMSLTHATVEDVTHTYLKDGQKNLDIYLRERITGRACSYDRMTLEQPNAGTESSAKMVQVFPGGRKQPFWVMSTDYNSYAVVYGCSQIVNQTGLCGEQNRRSSVWVRGVTQPLSDVTWSAINSTLESACTDPAVHQRVVHNKPGCRQCKPKQWTVQGNFDIDKYMGLWYEVMWIPPDNFPPENLLSDYNEMFTRGDNLVVVTRTGRPTSSRSGEPGKCLKIPDAEVTLTNIPGKLKYFYFREPDSGALDYWVLEVKYDEHAFVLGCRKLNSTTGECDNYTSFILTRSPHVTGRQVLIFKRLMDQYCLDASLYVPTDQTKDCSRNGASSHVSSILLLSAMVSTVLYLCL